MIKKLLQGKKDIGILILRLVIGGMFIYHGAPKLFGGAEKWEWLGSQMSNLGINFTPVLWGFAASLAEFFGGILLVIGLLTPLAALALTFNMFVATLFHFKAGQGMQGAAYAFTMMLTFLSMIFLGGGKYSIDYYLISKMKKK
jgi:putative oxidoreductase